MTTKSPNAPSSDNRSASVTTVNCGCATIRELTKPLIVANCRRVLTKWGKEKRPVETIFLKAGEKIPDLEKRNEETPKSEWIEGFDHKPKGPWEAQHVVYMVDPVSIDQYTYPTATIGGGIAVRELIDRILWMRRFKGNAVYPIVQLATRPMSIQRGTATRPRPHFEIVSWTKFDDRRSRRDPC